METWTTRMPPWLTAAFGVAELHAVFFQPSDDLGGPRDCVAIQIPEATADELSLALQTANRRKARVMVLCDTAEQAADAAGLATHLACHLQVSLERAEAGGWWTLGNL
jgi:hypothetical protein